MSKSFPTLSLGIVLTLCIQMALTTGAFSQEPGPRIVIGLVVDQMRWDYLIRFRDRYGQGGFRRLMDQGFSCNNTMIDYSPSVTACGHTCIYTGSVPAITGIVGNDWYDRYLHKRIYCTEDTTVNGVGATKQGRMSPANLLTTTIGDEMAMADNFKSKVVGIALKDRAAILPAGHTPTAAFWFDWETGSFISSTYYMKELPLWVQKFNDPSNRRKYYKNDWETLYPIESYMQSTSDDKEYEIAAPGEQKPVFPHKVSGKEYSSIRSTPFGDQLTLDFAKAAIGGYGLGLGKATDLLAISLSSPDAVGHQYGPNSVELEDTYLRLDRDLTGFLTWLDLRFGKGKYLIFMTADHGVASSPGYSIEHRMPGGTLDLSGILRELNDSLAMKFQVDKGIESVTEWQLYLNREVFAKHGIPLKTVEDYIAGLLKPVPGIAEVLSQEELESIPLPLVLKNKLINGYNGARSGDMIILPRPGWKGGGLKGADHGLIYPYDSHIPLLFLGWNIAHGSTNRLIGMTDITPTLAALLHIQAPSGCVGQPIEEIVGR